MVSGLAAFRAVRLALPVWNSFINFARLASRINKNGLDGKPQGYRTECGKAAEAGAGPLPYCNLSLTASAYCPYS